MKIKFTITRIQEHIDGYPELKRSEEAFIKAIQETVLDDPEWLLGDWGNCDFTIKVEKADA